MPASPLRILLLQQSTDPALDGLRAAIQRQFSDAERKTVQSPFECSALADRGWFPDLVAVGQAWPDEFTAAEIEAIIRSFPLARLVCCYGPWCSSDGRTRQLWPHAVRTPVDEMRSRLERERAVLEGRRPPLPLTASRDECIEFMLE